MLQVKVNGQRIDITEEEYYALVHDFHEFPSNARRRRTKAAR